MSAQHSKPWQTFAISSLLLIACTFVSGTAIAQSTMERVLAEKTVRLGVVKAYPWYRKDTKSGDWEGIIPDITKVLFDSINVNVEYVPTTWGTAVAGLQADKFDLIGAYNATPQRALAVDFTVPLGANPAGILALDMEAQELQKFETWQDVSHAGVSIAAVNGAAKTRAVQREIPNADWKLVKATDAMILELESGRADVMLSNKPTLLLYKKRKGQGFATFPTPSMKEPTSFAIRDGAEEFKDWLNIALQYYKANGEVEAIWDDYLR